MTQFLMDLAPPSRGPRLVPDMTAIRVDAERLRRDFDALAAIGATSQGGVDRPALSEAHLEARAWFREQIAADGFDLRVDGAGNHSAVLGTKRADARTLLLGSHLDSVPRGGRFDGALGVVAAYEVLRSVRDAGIDLGVRLEAIDFTDEEGRWAALMGSRAFAGSLGPEELDAARGNGEAFDQALERAGIDRAGILDAARDPSTLSAFLELHIEQGPRLVESGTRIGIVSSIVGIASHDLRFAGRADHAGTTPMDARRDAGLGAAAAVVAANDCARLSFGECVLNLGQARFLPGATNVVPESARLTLQLRAPDDDRLDALEAAVLESCRRSAGQHGVGFEARRRDRAPATPCSIEIREAIEAACDELELTRQPLVSGAGHDAGSLARICPAGMILIPSTGGSHSPREGAEWSDCVAGANVLLRSAVLLTAESDR